MKRYAIILSVLFFPILSVCHAVEYREGYLLVKFSDGITTAAMRQQVVNAAGGGVIERMYTIVPNLGLIKLPDGANTMTAKAAFSAAAGVTYAEPDYIQRKQQIPNDTQFNSLWGMHNTGQTGGTPDADIDAPEAWDLGTGSSNVIVAVIDTGVDYTHPDLAANMWTNTAELNGTTGVDDDSNGYIDDIYGYDFVNNDGDPMDDDDHGTHVSGTIGGVGNNGQGVAGVCWQVKIMALKFLGASGGGNTSDAISCIQYAIQMDATLTSNSWGGGGFSQALYDAIAAAAATDQLFVAAAGNSAMDNDQFPAYPASYDLDNIISVMSTTSTDARSSFSNWGLTSVDLAAPGSSILSAAPGGGYQYMSGTSMACPHVSGAAALCLSFAPTMTYAEVKQAILSSADPLSGLADQCVSGGRLNVYQMALLAQQGDALPPLPDPAAWLIEPTATGLTTIVMRAVKATDKSGVEYYFDCIENDTFDSGWQSGNLYQKSTYTAGTSYSFRVRARDKSENLNETAWSETVSTTTATGVDNLPPAPNPSQWLAFPRVTNLSRKQIGMEILTSYDENGVEYFFDCVLTDDPAGADAYDSGWRTSPSYTVTVASVTNYEYTFAAKARQLGTTDPMFETIAVTAPQAVGNASSSMVRVVPSAAYQTIQAAIDSSNNGDTVVVLPGVHREINIDFRGKAITVRSQDPENPAVVAATIIDCEDIWDYPAPPYDVSGHLYEARRAFMFRNEEGRDSVLAGITIRNAAAVDDADIRLVYFITQGDPDQGDRYTGAEWIDGWDAQGGAIYCMASPTIRNCAFQNCSANGQYGWHGLNGDAGDVDSPGGHADRGGNGGNAFGGAIYAVSGSSPLIQGCQFTDCRAVGGDAGNGGNGGDGGGHSDDVTNAHGYRGGDGGDAGLGGCAWGGAIYFEWGCSPELYDVTVENCFVQVGEAGHAGNGGNGSAAKGIGFGGHGGNGGLGGDLRAPNSYAGAVYYGDNTNATIEGCEFTNCKVIVELSGDYSGGDGGDGGAAAGDGTDGGNGGHGGPAYFVPDKLRDLAGGVTATGGTGGDGGAGGNGGEQGLPGNGGFRFGVPGTGREPGANFSLITQQTGIWPSNMYYLCYYWEDTDNINTLNTTTDPNDYFNIAWDWEWPNYTEIAENIVITTPPVPEIADPPTPAVPGAADSSATIFYIFDSDKSPFYGLLECTVEYTGIIVNDDPCNPGDPAFYTYDYSAMTVAVDENEDPKITPVSVIPLAPIDPNQPNSGACAGANYYGEGSVITMTDTVVSDNASFVNHAGGELYDRGCTATIENCTFENNTTLYTTTVETDYNFEGVGGGIFADQPVSMTFTGCQFNANNAHRGGGLYCNFTPTAVSGIDAVLNVGNSTFDGNKADYHFVKSYGGAVYAGNSFDPYEEFYFNDFDGYYDFVASRYVDHGYITFYQWIPTDLWHDELESDHITWGMESPHYAVSVADCNFVENLSPYGAGLCLDASNVTVTESQFLSNTAQVGAGGLLFACDATVQNNLFAHNTAEEVPTQSSQSQQDSGAIQLIGSGAGLYMASCDSLLTNNHFAANETNGYGGALYIDGLSLTWYPQSVFNCLFVENQAQYAGGALIAERGTDVEVLNCTFVDNTATDYYSYGGAILAHDAYMSITNTILWDNLAAMGPQLCVGEPLEPAGIYTTVYLNYSDIQGGQDDVYIDATGWPWLDYGDSNIEDNPATPEDESDPQFIDVSEPDNAVDRTFYLSETAAGQLSTSPCVDAGTPTHFIYDPAVGDFITIPGPQASSVLEWLAAKLGFDITTRTDHVTDGGVINMGYHYDAAKPGKTYTLTLVVDRGSDDPLMTRLKATGTGLDPFELYSPNSRTVSAGIVVSLEAIMNDPFYTVKAWHNTDDDTSTAMTNTVRMNADKTVILECETTVPLLRVTITGQGTVTTIVNGQIVPAHMTFWPKGTVVNLQATPTNPSDSVRWLGTDDDALLSTTNTVTMTESKDVEVTFYTPRIFDVTGDFTELQYAIDTAEDGDIIIVHEGEYDPVQGWQYVIGKNIVIQSYNPDDPAVVAGTIIRSTFVLENTDRTMVINGISIQDNHWIAFSGCDGNSDCNPLDDGSNGGPILGSGIQFYGNASATVKNCRIVNCSATGGNGGNGADCGDGGWGGWAHGGGVYVGSGDPRFINCEFVDNYAVGGSGGDGDQSPCVDRGGSWDEPLDPWPDWDYGPYLPYWKYSGYGGAVYCDQDSKPEFRNCLFSGNRVYGGHTGKGQGAYVNYPDPVGGYPNAWYKIDRYGGAVYVAERSEAVFTQCIFEDNQADTIGPEETVTHSSPVPTSEEDPYFAYGGTIAFEDDAVVTLNDCAFENGLAHHGGGIYAEHATLQISGGSFVGNTASFGGAVYYVDTEAMVDKTLFSDNAANLPESGGGAVFAFDANSVFTDVVVNGNSSGRSGGGFFVTDGKTTVKNALIIDNSAVRDGAGFSSDWYADVDLQNCTFSLNEVLGTASGVSQGGAVYAGYQSYVDIIDSILWANSAGQGQQICVGTGFEFDPVPSTVTISYSDVQGNRSASAVFVDTGCTLNWDDASMLYADPLFVGAGGGTDNYYLSQPSVEDPLADTSPCIDAGSDLANTLGLDKYTTAYPVPKFDMGMVDMGYHYPFEKSTDFCAYADLAYAAMGYQLDGVVGLDDLVILASHWLETQCDQTNRWCHGADLNFYNGVDFYDYVLMAGCWQAEDIEAPTPNPSQWAVTPRPVDGTTDSVEMEAVQATDNWIGGVEYYFDCLTPGGHASGWRQSFDSERPGYWFDENDPDKRAWIYTDSGLQSDVAYTYTVKTRDVAGNETAPAQAISAIPGEDVNPPSPDPSQWAVDGQPRQTSSTSVTMEAVQAVDAEGYGVEYLFVCVEDAAFSSGWRQNVDAGDVGYTATPWIYEVTGLTLGQTYTFYVKTRDRSVAQNETAPSVSVAVTMAEIDEEPPTPNPAQHAFQPDSVNTGLWYQIVVAAVATDPSGVEYKFVCSNTAFNSGGSQDPGPVWRNEDNVGFGTATPTYPGGLSYNGSAYQVPEAYIVQTGTHMESLLWWIYYRDRSPNQNIGRPSAKWAENGTLIPEGWDLP